MELNRNEALDYDLYSTIADASETVEGVNGKTMFLVDADFLAKAIAEEKLFAELEKGKQSIRDGNFHTLADFRKRFGLA